MYNLELCEEIIRLKNEKNALILAHYYQLPEIQKIADEIGDSLALSKIAAKTDKDIIVFCGVRFMAETAKLLSPHKKIIFPVSNARCAMADMIDTYHVYNVKQVYPEVPIVCYVNSSVYVKAQSDICCTSRNAVQIVQSMPDQRIIFLPDMNLANYVSGCVFDKEIIPLDGYCPVHDKIRIEDVEKAREEHPYAQILVHPECTMDVLEGADFVGGTGAIIKYISVSSKNEFVIGTELGIMYILENLYPDKVFHAIIPDLICPDMKLTTLYDLYNGILYEKEDIQIEEDIMQKATIPLNRMFNAV